MNPTSLSPLQASASALITALKAKKLRLVTAESCTGGMIASIITDIAGASDILEGGFVTYSNAQKIQILGVNADLIAQYGAVSAPVARAMALGALQNADLADLAIAVTGVAGPGASESKPAGLVFIALARRKPLHTQKLNDESNNYEITVHEYLFKGLTRTKMREQTTLSALNLLKAAL